MAFLGTASVAMWANINTQGTHSLRDSYNVSGIADVGGNTVRIEIDSDMSNGNYCVVCGAIEDDNSNTSRSPRFGNHTRKDPVTNFVYAAGVDHNGNGADVRHLMVVAIGDR
tara:strand:- start:47 stop:382 length:336 start_codon:yes stop_codon:yes gene_type:complete